MIGIITQASNIKHGDNPAYSKADFLSLYPQFKGLIPNAALEMYVELGNACVSGGRYHSMWKHAIGLFMASIFAPSIYKVCSQRERLLPLFFLPLPRRGVVTSEKVRTVFLILMDFSALTQDLNGWAGFKLTTFGVQFATLAKMVGKGGMYVW
ncbi:MAG: DUF4054 domain-containing protein [Dialister invisus]|uniref:DUF4054 domain-containing protein n=1 Tax=Dialister invisus TaxID=218538 RepID=UPI00399C37DC